MKHDEHPERQSLTPGVCVLDSQGMAQPDAGAHPGAAGGLSRGGGAADRGAVPDPGGGDQLRLQVPERALPRLQRGAAAESDAPRPLGAKKLSCRLIESC